MKIPTFLDINKPVQNSVLVFILLFVIYLAFFHKKVEEKYPDKKYLMPVIVIASAIVIFYIFKMIEINFS